MGGYLADHIGDYLADHIGDYLADHIGDYLADHIIVERKQACGFKSNDLE